MSTFTTSVQPVCIIRSLGFESCFLLTYVGQWLFLKALAVPVYNFVPTPYDVNLKYVPASLPMEVEVGVVICGPLSVILVQAGFMVACSIIQQCVGRFPNIM